MYLVEHEVTGKRYAMKKMAKSQFGTAKGRQRVREERRIMEMNSHPFIVNLNFAFQCDRFLYYVIDLAEGGELFTMLKLKGKFSEEVVRLYAAEIVLALEYLHNNSVLYSDLKLENLLIDSKGHVLLTDFGLSQIGDGPYSAFGTRGYLAPEAILKKPVTKAVDWWALVW